MPRSSVCGRIRFEEAVSREVGGLIHDVVWREDQAPMTLEPIHDSAPLGNFVGRAQKGSAVLRFLAVFGCGRTALPEFGLILGGTTRKPLPFQDEFKGAYIE